MFSTRKIFLALITLSMGLAAHAADFKAGEVIVKYKDGAARTRVATTMLYKAAGVAKVYHYTGMMSGFEQLFLEDGVKVQDAIAALMKSDAVEYAQPNYLVHIYPLWGPRHKISDNDPPIPGMPGGGGGGSLPCIPGLDIPGCDPNGGGGGGGGGGGIPGLPGGGDPSGNPLCSLLPIIMPGTPIPGCDGGGTPVTPPGGDPGSTQPPAQRPDLQPAPAEGPEVADPDLNKAWGIAKVGAIDAWKTFKGSKNFVVADIDTGIDYNHEDLAFNIWRNPTPGAQKDVVGFDFVHNDGLPYDDQGHGSHTAGTIGAVGGNGKGVSGVAYRVSIMAVKFLAADGSGTTADAIKAIDYAVAHGAKVLSNSWGGSGDDGTNQSLLDSINRAEKAGVLFVAAAGNGNQAGVGVNNDTDSEKAFPAAFNTPNEIAVAATDESDALAFFSNFGAKSVHLAAPGVNVYSTMPGNKYATESGTSMACPHVAGAAALVWAMHPNWDYKQVKDALLSSVDKVSSLAGKTVTGGRLNVLNALRATE